MNISNVVLTFEGVGDFTVDEYMDVTFTRHIGYWETHVSQLNEKSYPGLYKAFTFFVSELDKSEQFDITYDEFRRVMERVFQAYVLLKA